jgi:hypothetical protein
MGLFFMLIFEDFCVALEVVPLIQYDPYDFMPPPPLALMTIIRNWLAVAWR